MIFEITSKDNKNIKLIRQLKKKNIRLKNSVFVAEGRKIVLEAIDCIPDRIRCVVATAEFCEKEPLVLKAAEGCCENIYVVSQNIFNDLSDTDTPQGVLAVIEMGKDDFVPSENTGAIVVLDGISEPGNMGTVIRTAEALGFDAIYLMKGCTDIYSPKTVRSTMGSLFRMSFKENCVVEDIMELREKGFSVIATTPGGSCRLEDFKAPKKMAVVIGNEAHGVCDELLKLADFGVRISMDGMAESLNAAVAAGIVMHWLKNC